MRTVLASVLNDHYKIVVHTVWMQEIHEILLLIRLFPLKSSGRNLGNIVSFVRAIEKLFVFKKVCICYCNFKIFYHQSWLLIFFSGWRSSERIDSKKQPTPIHHSCWRKWERNRAVLYWCRGSLVWRKTLYNDNLAKNIYKCSFIYRCPWSSMQFRLSIFCLKYIWYLI